MSYLRRYAVGVFHESQSVPIDLLRDQDPLPLLRPAMEGVHGLPAMKVDDDQARRLVQGLDLDLDAIDARGQVTTAGDAAAVWQGQLLAIVHRRKIKSDHDRWWPKRVFPRD